MKRVHRLRYLHPSHRNRLHAGDAPPPDPDPSPSPDPGPDPSPSPDPNPPAPPPPGAVAVQLIFHTSTGLVVVDGSGTYVSDGSLDITTTAFTVPDTGTVVQIVIFGPGGPIFTEGTTGEVGEDGSLEIL